MSDEHWPSAKDERSAYNDHNLSQLRYFRSLSLRSKLLAVEGMADVVRRLKQMRKQGRFTQLNRPIGEGPK